MRKVCLDDLHHFREVRHLSHLKVDINKLTRLLRHSFDLFERSIHSQLLLALLDSLSEQE